MTPTAVALPTSREQRSPGRAGWAMMAPLALWLVLFVAAPLLILVVYGFCQRDELGRVTTDLTMRNYASVFDWIYLRVLWWSILYALLTTVLCAVIGYPVAYYIARASESSRNNLLMLVMIPFWTSFLIRTYAWMTILTERGLLNGLLGASGIIPKFISGPVDILYTPTAVVIGLVYSYLPFMILPIYGSVEKLDGSLLEAALDLGAGPLRAFWRVILPLTWPGVAAGAMLVFVPAIGMFAVTDLMGGQRVLMVGNVIQNQFLGQARNPPFGSAMAVVLMALFGMTYWAASMARRRRRA